MDFYILPKKRFEYSAELSIHIVLCRNALMGIYARCVSDMNQIISDNLFSYFKNIALFENFLSFWVLDTFFVH